MCLPGNGLRPDLHAGSVAGVGPRGVNPTIRPGHQLRVGAEETAKREADTRIEGNVVDGVLLRKRLSSIGGLCDEIVYFGVEAIITVVIPADVHMASGCGSGPRKEVMFLIMKKVVVHAHNLRRGAGVGIDGHEVDARGPFRLRSSDLICRKRTIRGDAMDS